MKRFLFYLFLAVVLLTATITGLTGCSDAAFDSNKAINAVTREPGSGTRGAFIELFGVEVKEGDTKKDMTTKEADEVNSTNVMLTNIAGNQYAIGYVSMGSLNDTVKALDINGIKATTANVKNGTYPITRPFNIAINGEAEGLTKDFIDFILSAEGQQVVGKDYVAVNDGAPSLTSGKPSGTLVVSGSSSVSPIMEKLIESYKNINENAKIELQTSDSTGGMNDAINGVCDIGMASRELKDSEKEVLTEITIAIDGIAVIVNTDNTFNGMTAEQVRLIYTGETTKWSEVK